jgi:ribosomal-protein-alanine N-acetyltransferase
MPEALNAIIHYAFTSWSGLNRIEAYVVDRNIASRRVLQKLGFRQEGFFRERLFADNQFHNESLYALLRSDVVAK